MPTNIGYYSWTVPEDIDAPDGPAQLIELATDIEQTMRGVEVQPLIRCRKTGAQTIPSGSTPTLVDFPTKYEDAAGMANAAGTLFTAKSAGVWLVTACLGFAANVTGSRYLELRVQNVIWASTSTMGLTSAGWQTSLNLAAVLRLSVNDVVDVRAAHLAGADLLTSTATPGLFSMVRLQP